MSPQRWNGVRWTVDDQSDRHLRHRKSSQVSEQRSIPTICLLPRPSSILPAVPQRDTPSPRVYGVGRQHQPRCHPIPQELSSPSRLDLVCDRPAHRRADFRFSHLVYSNLRRVSEQTPSKPTNWILDRPRHSSKDKVKSQRQRLAAGLLMPQRICSPQQRQNPGPQRG